MNKSAADARSSARSVSIGTPKGKFPRGFDAIANMNQQQFVAEPPANMNLKTHTLAPTTIMDLPSPVNSAVSPSMSNT